MEAMNDSFNGILCFLSKTNIIVMPKLFPFLFLIVFACTDPNPTAPTESAVDFGKDTALVKPVEEQVLKPEIIPINYDSSQSPQDPLCGGSPQDMNL